MHSCTVIRGVIMTEAYKPHAYNPKKHQALFGPQNFGHDRNSSEPKPDAVLGTSLVLLNVAVILGVIIFLAALPGILQRRAERRRRLRLMEDTDTAASSTEGMEMMNVSEPEARPTPSGEHEEQGQRPRGTQLVVQELDKLRMTVYADRFERHGYDNWP